ncbi:basic secretory protein-like protein [Pedobacter sp. KR3-3]|uniref:Basic secretory protein-like protein n=1 Tax=Pedobacter albus TaxID=3113905 RepID=A0ABU7I749_9SPHI|nr:basic secretory protein-like protein [Pedobacter sp. KR3-3]MEE1945300.1 basic secretory protein-like protein [Pedobacter sp. KR3-3]
MNKTFLTGLALVLTAVGVRAQNPETITRKGYTLTFLSNSASFDPALKQRMIETFFKVYPVLAKDFNQNADKAVTFSIDTAYKGVAATGGGRIVYNPEWFVKHPGDIDVVTHEVMHVVQNYGNGGGPGWLTEGIADYVRFKYGVDNPGANWTLTPFKPEQSYKNAYRITARFLNWLETHGHKGIVVKLDNVMRTHTYKETVWKDLTGKTVDELWAAYAANPNA